MKTITHQDHNLAADVAYVASLAITAWTGSQTVALSQAVSTPDAGTVEIRLTIPANGRPAETVDVEARAAIGQLRLDGALVTDRHQREDGSVSLAVQVARDSAPVWEKLTSRTVTV